MHREPARDQNWHSLSSGELLQALETTPAGLHLQEVHDRLAKYGRNELQEAKKTSPVVLFFEGFREPLVAILLAATVISALIGEIVDAVVIMAIVVAATALSFTQEYRAERSLALLKSLAAPAATVVREGQQLVIPAKEIVPGDVVIVRSGDKVPADLRVIESFGLKADEATLTGESTSVGKQDVLLPAQTPLAERKNTLFSGTIITNGRGRGVVFATGAGTEFGKIASMLESVKKEPTPLEVRMDRVGNWFIKALVAIVALVTILDVAEIYFRDQQLTQQRVLDMFLWGVSLAVAAVPEALPAIVTGALAVGVHRMAKRHAIVRRLPVVETLGCTTVICSDKTGTLTKGEMSATRIWADGHLVEVSGVGYEPKGDLRLPSDTNVEDVKFLATVAALCCDARLVQTSRWEIQGDPTEGALLVAAAKLGLSQDSLNQHYPRAAEVAFTSERKAMTTIHTAPDGKLLVCTKGAPEAVLKRCGRVRKGARDLFLSRDEIESILQANEKMASDGLRVLGVAFMRLDQPLEEYGQETVERELVFLGLFGMIDQPREEAIQAVQLCKKAGVRVVMITGDHKLTATTVAKELGLINSPGVIITGAELDALSEEQFERIVDEVSVYARTSAEHKIRIVKTLKKKGHVVAMTGDGINDAPALKNSDVGVAMGITGTDVTKEASDVVLADDNFATIIAAVKEGRGIFDNIRKYLTYLLSVNIGEIIIMAVAGLGNLPLPLLAKQILYVNLATDGLPAIALGIDPPDKYVMDRPPRLRTESVFAGIHNWLAGISILIAAVSLGVFFYALILNGWSEGATIRARSMLFATIILFEILFALSCRSFQRTIFDVGFFTNKYLLIAIGSQVILLYALFAVQFLNQIFEIVPLTISEWAIVIAAASSGFILSEIAKASFTVFRKFPLRI